MKNMHYGKFHCTRTCHVSDIHTVFRVHCVSICMYICIYPCMHVNNVCMHESVLKIRNCWKLVGHLLK